MCIYYLKQKDFDEAQKKYKRALERGKKKNKIKVPQVSEIQKEFIVEIIRIIEENLS